MAFSCIKASLGKCGLFTLQVCTSHNWHTDYDYATAIPAGAGNIVPVTARFVHRLTSTVGRLQGTTDNPFLF
ncbi:hypothetical protein EH120_19315 [Salmonella enterica subsp. enterica]|nr:hypothetical protein [Salmonella enterica subsp. enterica serovar Omuna]ECI6123870.1 hypothetical protein [Salmonella enterica subsp. enterica]EDS6039392.1 hypothetical protein [Salmonella enterica subsp. enterica serovar Lexington]EEB9695223.1 hypothetical protein [Salmonella enterica subsp. enterica serovar Miami]